MIYSGRLGAPVDRKKMHVYYQFPKTYDYPGPFNDAYVR